MTLERRPDFKDETLEEKYKAALPHLSTRENEVHTNIAISFAARLLKAEEADPAIVLPAIILHDIGWIKVPQDQLSTAFGPSMKSTDLRDLHETMGAKMAAEILNAVGYPKAQTEKITLIIGRHDSYLRADTIEEAVVKDSDKLWRYSARGVAVDSARFGSSPASLLASLGESLPGWFLTKTGAGFAREELSARMHELAIV